MSYYAKYIYGNVTSNVATLTVTPPVGNAPTITKDPISQTVASGSNVTFTVEATGNAPLTYQWQQSADNGATWNNFLTGATITFGVGAGINGYLYRCIVTNDYGETTSAAATLTVTP